MADPHCLSLGIPERLHQEDRPELADSGPEDRLFRRFNLYNQAHVTACIRFNSMSVNRERLSEECSSIPADVLINERTGRSVRKLRRRGFRSRQPAGHERRWSLEGKGRARGLRNAAQAQTVAVRLRSLRSRGFQGRRKTVGHPTKGDQVSDPASFTVEDQGRNPGRSSRTKPSPHPMNFRFIPWASL